MLGRLKSAPSDMEDTMGIAEQWHQAMVSWIGWFHSSSKPETTIYLRGYQIRRVAADFILLGIGPWEATLDDLSQWLGSFDWAPETRRSYRATLRTFYTWAHVTGRIGMNPAALLPGITPPRGLPRPVPEQMYRAAVIKAHERERLMLRLAGEAGLRRGEIAVVRPADVERDDDGWALRVHGKGSKERRVPISDSMAGAIRRSDDMWLFPGQIDGHLSAPRVGELISELLDEGWTAHKCRHRFASIAFEVDRDIRAVQELLGHASVVTTQIYTLVPTGAKRRAALAAAA